MNTLHPNGGGHPSAQGVKEGGGGQLRQHRAPNTTHSYFRTLHDDPSPVRAPHTFCSSTLNFGRSATGAEGPLLLPSTYRIEMKKTTDRFVSSSRVHRMCGDVHTVRHQGYVTHARQTTRFVMTVLQNVFDATQPLTRWFLGHLATPTVPVCTVLAAASPADVADVVVAWLPEDGASQVPPSPPSPRPPNISNAAITRFSSVVATESWTSDNSGC